MRNHKSRISLIKQVVIGVSPIVAKQYVLDFVKVRLLQETATCDRSLIYGDIDFGDDELN